MLDLQGYGPSIFNGAIITIQLALFSLVIAVILGLVTAVARYSGGKLASTLAVSYTSLVRGVPDLVLMMLMYFGLQVGLNSFSEWLYELHENYAINDFYLAHGWTTLSTFYDDGLYINIDEFNAGVLTIGFIFGAYMAETFRGALLSVDKGQIEAATAYGMSEWRIFRRVMFPQMMRFALPGIGNNWLVLVKTTALVSVIGLSDMVKLAKEAAMTTYQPFVFFIPVALVYLAITTVSEIALKYLERHYSKGVEGH
jgi:arginine/ornithine transport system permease protein